MIATQASVTTAAAVLVAAAQQVRGCVLINRGTASVFLGGDNTVTSASFELLAGASIGIDIPIGEAIWAIAASGIQRVDILRAG